MVASSSTEYQGPMPMAVDRIQKRQEGKNDRQKGKGKDAKGKGKRGKGYQKGKEGDHKCEGKGKDQKCKGVAACYTGGKRGHLAKDCWRNYIRQVASDQTSSSSGGASVTTQHASVSQQGSSAETKPAVRRTVNSEPTIFDLRQGDDELEDQGVRVFHFYIGVDDDDDDDDKGHERLNPHHSPTLPRGKCGNVLLLMGSPKFTAALVVALDYRSYDHHQPGPREPDLYRFYLLFLEAVAAILFWLHRKNHLYTKSSSSTWQRSSSLSSRTHVAALKGRSPGSQVHGQGCWFRALQDSSWPTTRTTRAHGIV